MSEKRRSAADCSSMDEVRVEIDRLDQAIVECMAERFTYVDRAWQLKGDPSQATVPWRIQQVIDRVRAHADEHGLPPDLAEAIWRQMIGWFIQYEEQQMMKRDGGAD